MKYTNLWTARLLQIIKEVATEIKPIVGTEIGRKKYTRGAGGDITLEIDRRAETSILDALQTYGESFNIISEEIGNRFWDAKMNKFIKKDSSEYLVSTNYFFIDPIDGSTNAKRGIPFFCISIAYGTGPNYDDLQAGIVFNIATNDAYVAEKHQGAYLNDTSITCSSVSTLDAAIIGTDLDPKKILPEYAKFKKNLLEHVRKVRVFGSCALELCLVAQGALDIYFDMRGITRIVDIAAGIIILSEAGGTVWNETFTPIRNHELSLGKRYALIVFSSTLQEELREKKKRMV